MSKLGLISVLVLSLPAYARAKSADYTIQVHVPASRIGLECRAVIHGTECSPVQRLTVLIDGGKYELESESNLPKGIVALGDYKAKLIDDHVKPTHEFTRSYDLMFPDGSTRTFRVIGEME